MFITPNAKRIRQNYKAKEFDPVSQTRQEFGKEVNINTIMKKAIKYGLPPSDKEPFYADVSDLTDYSVYVQKINDVEDRFMELDSRIRARFDNDPNKLAKFLLDPSNIEEGRKLGLVKPEDKQSVPPPNVGMKEEEGV